jgi:polyhydroxybutyrate depolymerase
MKKIYLFSFIALLFFKSFSQYSTHSFAFGGVTRQYLLYVPPSYDGSQAVPFILALHGLGDNMNNFAGINFNVVADTANFIFAIPQALVDSVLTGSTAWNSGAGEYSITLNPNVDDVGFLNALIDTVSAHYVIDSTRLYSTGFSMGGFMTNRLGCELNNRIAAIASVSGTIGSGITCHPSRVVPSCHFHGTADQMVSYTGDMFGSDPEALVAFWRGHDRCDSMASSIDTLPHVAHDSLHVVHYVYPHGAYGSDVEFYKVINGQHQWLGPVGEDINYAVAIWNFFNRYKWVPQANIPTAINNINPDIDITTYPNPASSKLTLNIPHGVGDVKEIIIRDISGRIVYTATNIQSTDVNVDVKAMSRGVYTLQVKVNDQTITKKICLID